MVGKGGCLLFCKETKTNQFMLSRGAPMLNVMSLARVFSYTFHQHSPDLKAYIGSLFEVERAKKEKEKRGLHECLTSSELVVRGYGSSLFYMRTS